MMSFFVTDSHGKHGAHTIIVPFLIKHKKTRGRESRVLLEETKQKDT